MGIDLHSLNFLRFACAKQPLGQVATIGRQGLHVDPFTLKRLMGFEAQRDFGAFCEDLLTKGFGAISVDSYDNSLYENATFVGDMNLPLKADKFYDTVFDGGCLEHIFNAPQALHNISSLCAPGGQILHVLPANNFCGHGFWQFSPELFFSLYTEKNGYCETQVFIADLLDTDVWYEVEKPQRGLRVNVSSSSALYVMVRTKRTSEWFVHANIQQSDYVHLWNGEKPPAPSSVGAIKRMVGAIKRSPLAPLAKQGYRKGKRISLGLKSVSSRNPGLVRRPLSMLL